MVMSPHSLAEGVPILLPKVRVFPGASQVQRNCRTCKQDISKIRKETFFIDTCRFISPKGCEAKQGSVKLVELKKILDALHLFPVVVIFWENFKVRIDVSLDLTRRHPEHAAHPNLTVTAHLGDPPQARPDRLRQTDLVSNPARHGDLQHSPRLPLTDVQVADPS